MSENKYPLEWLDILIEKLKPNPANRNNITDMSHEGIDVLSIAESEVKKLKLRIRKEIFGAAFPKKNRKFVANYYHETTTYYMNILYGIDQPQSNQIIELQNQLRNLLNYLESHFSDYLKVNRRVPKYNLASAKLNLRELLDEISKRGKNSACAHTRNVINIVTGAMDKFLGS